MPTRTYSINVPAEASMLKLVRAFYRKALDLYFASEDVGRLLLALDECASNVVRHRCTTIGAGVLSIALKIEGDLARFRFGSFCRADDISEIAPRDLSEVRPGGLGTHFVVKVMDAVRYEATAPDSDVRNLILEKRIPPREGDEHGPLIRD